MSDAPKFKTFRDLRGLPSISGKRTGDDSTDTARETGAVQPSVLADASEREVSEISPTRDFHKVPNSVSRNLGLFRGKSKQVWDYLWSVSRGSVNPARTIRKSRKEIKDGSKVGSLVTVDAAVGHLIKIGLIRVVKNIGSTGGNEYEIFAPSEVETTSTTSTSTPSTSSSALLYQNLDILDILGSGRASRGQVVENKDIYSPPKTSLKTKSKNDDDSALVILTEILEAASRKIVKKSLSKSDQKKWGELGELLVMEMELAAARTRSVSNLPAFLTEHLRRRLAGREKTPQAAPNKFSETGKFEAGEITGDEIYEAESLSETGRQTVLGTFREYFSKGQSEFIKSFEESYTKNDWSWLMSELKMD